RSSYPNTRRSTWLPRIISFIRAALRSRATSSTGPTASAYITRASVSLRSAWLSCISIFHNGVVAMAPLFVDFDRVPSPAGQPDRHHPLRQRLGLDAERPGDGHDPL